AHDRHRVLALLLDGPLHLVELSAVAADQDDRAVPGQLECRATPYAGGRAGDDVRLAFFRIVHQNSLRHHASIRSRIPPDDSHRTISFVSLSSGKPSSILLTASSRSICAGESFTSTQARLSFTWASLRAPRIGMTGPERCRSQARATCAGESPLSR